MAKGKVGSRRIAAQGAARADKSANAEKLIAARQPMLIGLMITAALAGGLAIFQWQELINAQLGHDSFCAINETFNCVSVWESGFSKAIHRTTRMPVAGWGLVWALTALGAALLAFLGQKKSKSVAREVGAIRLIAAIGLLTSVVLFIVTLQLGQFCITCWATYALVISYGLFAWKVAPPYPTAKNDMISGVSLAAVLTAGGYLLLLYPGLRTPVEIPKLTSLIPPKTQQPVQQPQQAQQPDPQPQQQRPTGDLLSDFLIQLPRQVQQGVADSLEEYRLSAPKPRGAFAPRKVLGGANAPVQIIEWSDIRCSHCKAFSEALHSIDQSSPDDAFSIELRQFPLDYGCNPLVNKEMVDSTGVRCAAAQALICIEDTAGFRDAQEKLFAQQHALTFQMVMGFATAAGKSLPDLVNCMKSPATAKKLKEDIDFAMMHGLSGTPLVVINGRQAPSYEPFVYALVLAAGDERAQGWSVLPKGQPGSHAGHDH